MSKIIIHNNTDLSDEDALIYVTTIVRKGKISKVGDLEQYCFVVSFKNGIVISSGRKNDTYTFWIDKEK